MIVIPLAGYIGCSDVPGFFCEFHALTRRGKNLDMQSYIAYDLPLNE
jgi:hypothetical protein